VGGVHAPAGERQQDRGPLGEADQRGGSRDSGDGCCAVNVAARHFTKTDMERAGYTFQMKPHPETYLNLDGAQMGAGGIDSWSPNAYPMTPYRLPSGEERSFSYTLKGVAAEVAAKQ